MMAGSPGRGAATEDIRSGKRADPVTIDTLIAMLTEASDLLPEGGQPRVCLSPDLQLLRDVCGTNIRLRTCPVDCR